MRGSVREDMTGKGSVGEDMTGEGGVWWRETCINPNNRVLRLVSVSSLLCGEWWSVK